MLANVDPSVTLLISKVRRAEPCSRFELMIQEMKKMAARGNKDDDIIDIWKKLYLLSKGAKINPLDFVKASASSNLLLKKMGYQGLLEPDCAKHLVLMPNTLSKDLEAERYASEALAFLSNINDESRALAETALKIKVPSEDSDIYSKSIVAKSKYADELLFSMVSSNESHLFVKLQIVLDKHLVPMIKSDDVEFLKSTIFSTESPFTKLKILQTLYKAFACGKLALGENLVRLLKNMIILPPKRAKKQIEIGLAIEATKLLIVSGNVCDEVEEFVFRLINSENTNSQHLGFKIISKYKIIPETAINRIMELGVSRKMYLDSLFELVSRSNYNIIHRRIGELAITDISNREDTLCHERSIDRIMGRLCEFGDQEFVCRALYENPRLYNYVKKKSLFIPEQSKSLFNMILHKDNSDYFPMIYDLFPAKIRSCEEISSLCLRHLSILANIQKDESNDVLDHLIDFMCVNGDIASNRQMILDVLSSATQVIKTSFFQKLISSVLLFNMVLPDKLFHIRDGIFVEYSIGKRFVEIRYPYFIKDVRVLVMDFVCEKKEGGKIIKRYEIGARREMEVVVIDQGTYYRKRVWIKNLS